MSNSQKAFIRCRGFTLLESVMVIVITGILGAVVAVFIRAPVEGYVASVGRAELTDAADTALRRVARDVHTALPNSVRTTSPASGNCIEFLPTVGGGRYRVEVSSAAPPPEDVLKFTSADNSFDVLASTNLPPTPGYGAATYYAVVYNLGVPGADAYNPADNNRATIRGTSTAANIVLTPANKFPFASPGKRFHVIPDYSVAYSCSGGNLLRSTQAISATPLGACPSAGTVLVSGVSSCSFSYTVISGRSGLLTAMLGLTQSGETVQLLQEVHVENDP
jgi:MSHA biogenesis protein MshO